MAHKDANYISELSSAAENMQIISLVLVYLESLRKSQFSLYIRTKIYQQWNVKRNKSNANLCFEEINLHFILKR